ncbi:MAG: single-stranded-DNA-specific exonuclease RecJ [Nanoarchaeota archaeon]|nr:single-stranded-DNA-specific exonuclease RecJ [Nanoarchaeota archaeon]
MPYNIRRQLNNNERARFSGISDTLAHLLFHRGISDDESAQKFISPNYEKDVHDPFLLKDAEKSATRIIHAIENNERIAIYADYDADGIPGATILDDFFKRIGFKNYSVYIPHRHDEGFGLNVEAVEQLATEGVKLLITIDCGITDIVPIKRANELGVEIIVTDHHEPPPVLPEAFAIVDHKQADCKYPDKNICGSGVIFKLIQAILKKNRFGLKEGHEKWLLDLVGLATLSDMVPLTGENRVFAHYGLAVLRKSPRKGLMQLLKKLRIDQRHLMEDDITFMITPRINAASRMGVPMDAFKLLSADNDNDAYIYAEHLDKINNERKGVVASLVKEVKKTVHERYGTAIPSVIVLGNPLWRPSLLGLAANSCAEEFNRPVFLWGRDGDDAIKGSCRSEGKTNIVELMRAVPVGVLSQFGGHHHSGGFAVSNEQIHYLEMKLCEAYKTIEQSGNGAIDSRGSESDFIDAELTLDEVDSKFYEDLNKLAPFGVGNPKPVFLFKKVIPETIRKFGKGNDHVEIVFKKSNDEKITAISFFGSNNKWMNEIRAGKGFDLVASVEKSMYRGKAELRLRIVDIFTED